MQASCTGEPQLTVILFLAPEHNDHSKEMPPDVQNLVGPYELSPFITEVGACFFFSSFKAFCTFRIHVKIFFCSLIYIFGWILCFCYNYDRYANMLQYRKRSGKNNVRYGQLHFILQPSKLHALFFRF